MFVIYPFFIYTHYTKNISDVRIVDAMRNIFLRIKNIIPKRTLGVIFIVLGFLALVTPFTPGSWLIFVGLEFLGLRYVFQRPIDRFLKMRRKKDHVDPGTVPKETPEKK